MNAIKSENLDMILIVGGKIYLEEHLPFNVFVYCKSQNGLGTKVYPCYQNSARVRASFTFEFKDLKIYATLHHFNFAVNQD